MLLGVVVVGAVCLLAATVLARRWGWGGALAVTGFVWSLAVIGFVTLIPANGAPGIVYPEDRLPYCSLEIGGPAPDGFWIFPSGQRLLNTVLFVPSGLLLVLAAVSVARRWSSAVVTVPLGLTLLAAYSLGIEKTQFELARLDRACDITDVVDNVTGAVIGFALGVLLLPVLRPWRWGHPGR